MCPACSEYDICLIPIDGKGFGEQIVSEFIDSRPEWCPMKEEETLEMRLQHACECYEELEKEYNKQPQIVRCKDCKYNDQDLWMQNTYKGRMAWCAKNERLRENDWFCADGECKEGR